jgi:hypothetical protein
MAINTMFFFPWPLQGMFLSIILTWTGVHASGWKLTVDSMLVGQVPNSIIIHKVPPRIWLPSMVIIWAGLTMAGAGCKTYGQLCAVRFLMGLAEASTYAGCIYVMGSW